MKNIYIIPATFLSLVCVETNSKPPALKNIVAATASASCNKIHNDNKSSQALSKPPSPILTRWLHLQICIENSIDIYQHINAASNYKVNSGNEIFTLPNILTGHNYINKIKPCYKYE